MQELVFKHYPVAVASDGYIAFHSLMKYYLGTARSWLMTRSTRAAIDHIGETNPEAKHLVRVFYGRSRTELTGTWIHPLLFAYFLFWRADPDLDAWALKHFNIKPLALYFPPSAKSKYAKHV